MSNSLLPKKAPNLLNQETLERALVALRQPFSIAVLASLGLHGLLWTALPNFLVDTEKELETKQRVQVVELSPVEQSQLPQFATSQLPATLLPGQSAKPTQSGTKLPDPKLYNNPPLYSIPGFPPPPNFPTDFSDLLTKTLPPPSPNIKKKTPASKPKTPAPRTLDPGTLKPENDPGNPGDSGNPGNTASKDGAPARSDRLSPEQLAALQQDRERSRQLQALYTFNGPDTSEKATGVFSDNATNFRDAAAKLTGGDADDARFYKTPERVNGRFPKEACPFVRGLRNASFGAIVKPDGTLAEPPFALLPSGYPGLDNAAKDDITNIVKNKKFGDGGRFQLIRFDFIFDPKSACSSPDKPA